MKKSPIKLYLLFSFFLILLIFFSLFYLFEDDKPEKNAEEFNLKTHNTKQAKSIQSNINQPYGLFFVEANNPEKEIFAGPTLKTDVNVKVQGLLTTKTVIQYFINPTNSWMEAIYLFPLPDKSGVDFLRMKIGDRFIEGKIQEKEKGRPGCT